MRSRQRGLSAFATPLRFERPRQITPRPGPAETPPPSARGFRGSLGSHVDFVTQLGDMPMTLPPLGPVQSGGHDKDSGPQVPYYSLWTEPNGTSSLATGPLC